MLPTGYDIKRSQEKMIRGVRMLMSNEERGGGPVLRGGAGHGIWLHLIFSEEFHGLSSI